MTESADAKQRIALEYASARADGLPGSVPEADQLIAGLCRPIDIRDFFRRTEDAVSYYARVLSETYSMSNVAPNCVMCGREAPQVITQVRWEVRSKFKRREIRLNEYYAQAHATTLHAICADCYGELSERLARLARPVHVVSLGVPFLWALLILSWVFATVMHRNAGKLTSLLWFLIVAVSVMARLLSMNARRRIPQFFRSAMPRGVYFHSLGDLFVVEDGTAKTAMVTRTQSGYRVQLRTQL